MSKKLKIQTMVGVVVFFLISMSVMLVQAGNKVIVVADIAQDQVLAGSQVQKDTVSEGEAEKKLQHFRQPDGGQTYLRIPLEAGIKAENVKIENHYVDRELWIYIEGEKSEFYEEAAVTGNVDGMESGTYKMGESAVVLKFPLKDNYECRNTLKENFLHIELLSPKELYEKIVVIDASHGGEDTGFQAEGISEKDITLDIVKKLKAKLEKEEIKIYYTRTEDENPSWEDRVGLANGVQADMFISIALNSDMEDTRKYGTEAIYHETFFIPDFGSVELADLVEREVVTSISGRGNGLVPATEEDTLVWNANVPATVLKVGYLSNPQEAALLAKEDYRERVAEGLCRAILKAYEKEAE